ncbi:MAG: HEAT repeat domain-containing protein [Puniceicoccales bacterium]
MTTSIKVLLSTVALAAAALPLSAQNRPSGIPRNLFPPSLMPEPRLSPEEKATIERALEDLRSDNSEYRAGAVMLLGKYDSAQAREAVIKALEDPSTRVRRAAMVSVMEWNRAAPATAIVPVLRLVGDEDVELRRSASTAIQPMIAIRAATEALRPGVRVVIPDDVRQILIDAYLDEDVIVRRNMLTNHFYLNLPVPGETFIALMGDEDPQVRLEAVGLAARFAEPDAFTREAQRWIENGNRTERLRLPRELPPRPSTAQLELLRMLSEDEDDEIAAEAMLARFRALGTDATFEKLYARLNEDRLKQEQAQRFLQILRMHSGEVPGHIEALTGLDDPLLRREAVDLFFDMGYAQQQPEQVLIFIADPSEQVRAVVLKYYERRHGDMPPQLREAMLTSRHPEVRQSLATMSATMPDDIATELLLDLLLDDQTAIRQQSLREIARRQLPGWQDILLASLNDDDLMIQRSAAELIMRTQMPGGTEALRQLLQSEPDTPLAPLIRLYLEDPTIFQRQERR